MINDREPKIYHAGLHRRAVVAYFVTAVTVLSVVVAAWPPSYLWGG